MSFDFVPSAALPPKTNISEPLCRLAEVAAAKIGCGVNEIMPALRLLSPFGSVTGLGHVVSNHSLPLLCIILNHFAQHYGRSKSAVSELGQVLLSNDLVKVFPALPFHPTPNSNILFDVHARLVHAPAYRLLAIDLQHGVVALMNRTQWQHSSEISKSLDARLSGAFRIVPLLNAESFEVALHDQDPELCGQIVWKVAEQLHHFKSGKLLASNTRSAYFLDACRLLNHPEWAETVIHDTPLGTGKRDFLVKKRSHFSENMEVNSEDVSLHDDSNIAKIERQVRRDLHPGTSLEELGEEDAISSRLSIYGEELSVMREFLHHDAWNCAHPNDLIDMFRLILLPLTKFLALDETKLGLRTLILSILLTGRDSDWLLQIVVGKCSETEKNPGSTIPTYFPECDAIAYFPTAAPDLPTTPLHHPDLYEPVSEIWWLPLPQPLIPLWRELASRRRMGDKLFSVSEKEIRNALAWLTKKLRKRLPHRSAMTEGRLRMAYTTLMVNVGMLDPLVAAFISEQWSPALRVPLYYTTLRLSFLAEQYRAATQRVWDFLRRLSADFDLPFFECEPNRLPEMRLGSPYLPKLEVIRNVLLVIESAIETALDEDQRHNALLLKLFYGFSIFLGLRMSEAESIRQSQIDLSVYWGGKNMAWLVLPQTRSNYWTTASRIVPIPRQLHTLVKCLLSTNADGFAFHFRVNGVHLPATESIIRDQLAALQVVMSKWHGGRHLFRTLMVEYGFQFDEGGAVIGHQSSGHEIFNFYSPHQLSRVWESYEKFADHIAGLIDWKSV